MSGLINFTKAYYRINLKKYFYNQRSNKMAVKMRLTRMGDKKSPFYRIVVIDSRKAQSGEYIEKIGHVDPLKSPAEVVIDVEKAKSWLSKGVQPTETVRSYLIKAGVIEQPTKLSAPKTNDKKKKNS